MASPHCPFDLLPVVRGIPTFLRDRVTRKALLGALGAASCVPLAALVAAARAPTPPHAYHFAAWLWWDPAWRQRLAAAHLSYPRHLVCRAHLAGQLLVAGSVGFVHAFFAGLVPFVAEECGAQLFALVSARRLRGGRPDYVLEGRPYAYTPRRWIYAIDGKAHVAFSGGTWANHARFACWASGQFIVGAACGFVHALVPPLFPTVAEEVTTLKTEARECARFVQGPVAGSNGEITL
jgi:hypothetical protein